MIKRLFGFGVAAVALTAVVAPGMANAADVQSPNVAGKSIWVEQAFKTAGPAHIDVTVSCPANYPHYTGSYKEHSTDGKIFIVRTPEVSGAGTAGSPEEVTFRVGNASPFEWDWAGVIEMKCS